MSIQQSHLHNSQIILPQDGCCGEVQLYNMYVKILRIKPKQFVYCQQTTAIGENLGALA